MSLLLRIKHKLESLEDFNKVVRKTSRVSTLSRQSQTNKSYISIKDFSKFIQAKKTNKMYKLLESAVMVELEGAIAIRKRRYKFYKSENQMQMFQDKTTPIIYRTRFRELLSNFLTDMNVDIIIVMLQYNSTDDDIYQFIKQKFKRVHHNTNPMVKLTTVGSVIHTFVDMEKYSILDIGSGNGKNICMLKRAFKNKDISISGTDIPHWGPYNANQKHDYPFRPIELNPYRIPWNDESFECITLFFVLHHVKNLKETLQECRRILKQNGTLVIIEHDVWDDYDHMLIDIQHNVYRHIYNEADEYSNYMNFYEWDVAMLQEGFKPVYTDKMKEHVDFKHRFDLQFLSVYKKCNANTLIIQDTNN